MDLTYRKERGDWVKVLEVLYDHQMMSRTKGMNEWEKIADWSNKLNILIEELSVEMVEENVPYLLDMGLITGGEMGSTIGLTQEGLQLAHQIKTERQRRNTNIILLALTAVLVVLTALLMV